MHCEYCGGDNLFFVGNLGDSFKRCQDCGALNELSQSMVSPESEDEGSYEMPEVDFN